MHKIIQSALSTALHLKRVCPACKKPQVVAPSRRQDTVTCKNCGAKIPPAHKGN